MKKILPYLIISLSFVAFLTGQVVFDLYSTDTSVSEREQAKAEYLSNAFRQLSLTSLSGKQLLTSDIQGPIIVLVFWTEWCAPCFDDLKDVIAFKDQFKHGDVTIIGINSDDDPIAALARSEMKLGKRLPFETVDDHDGTLAHIFKVSDIPSTILFVNGQWIDPKNGQKFRDPDFVQAIRRLALH